MGWLECIRNWLEGDEPDYIFDMPHRAVNKIYIHCSDSDNPAHDNIETVRNWHIHPRDRDDGTVVYKGGIYEDRKELPSEVRNKRGNGWNDIGYHIFINSYGNVSNGRSFELIPAAQKGHNYGSIAICLSGRKDLFNETQFDSLRDVCRAIRDAYKNLGIQVTFHGHNEVDKGKSCPVIDYREILKLDKNGKLGL